MYNKYINSCIYFKILLQKNQVIFYLFFREPLINSLEADLR